ncbi:hypothetical protein [Roseiconus lacunae]|uniref:hypothetical protein n=1 Tax=Roseiconus lacunae TaxID=2605694 RepID=UPI001E522D41|nr:hypothetical protein [Roseiconus lacunae]MCD0462367.1 hypothetical protein [Roseiconus lacunae]
MPLAPHELAERYIDAKNAVVEKGFAHEIDWYAALDLRAMTETDFLREAAWVILNAGMRESVVRSRFQKITDAFLGWRDAASIVETQSRCEENGRLHFNHDRKIKAIVAVAKRVLETEFEVVKRCVVEEGPTYLITFDFIGPVTSLHLAKNLGANVVKPDRHLVRIAAQTHYSSAKKMCEAISFITGEKLAVIDTALWRFAAITPKYERYFATKRKVESIV